MIRNAAAALLAAALLLGGAAEEAGAGPQSSEIGRFRRAFAGDDPPVPVSPTFDQLASLRTQAANLAAERLEAARALLLMDDRAAAEAIAKGVGVTLDKLDSLAAERARAREGLARLQEGDGRAPGLKEKLAVHRVLEEDLRERDLEHRSILSVLRRALTAFREPRTLDYLAQSVLRSSPHPGVRAEVAEALGTIGDPATMKGVVQACGDRDPRVREAALAALGRIREEEKAKLAALGPALEDPNWTVRLAAARQVAALASPGAVDLLLPMLAREEGRLRGDVAGLLREMTGQKFGVEPEGWTHWWAESREEFVSGERRLHRPAEEVTGRGDSGGMVSYYGITTWSKRILYVIDVSGSMNSPGATSPDLLKIDEAKAELQRSIRSLDPKALFSIVAFGDAVRVWKPGLQEASAKIKDEAGTWIHDLMAANWTNTHAALEEAIRMSAADPRNNMGKDYDRAADTIFLLTDGAPTTPAGELVDPRGVPETKKVLEAVREWNRDGRVVIHAVGVGPNVDERFLQALARENGGEYRRVK